MTFHKRIAIIGSGPAGLAAAKALAAEPVRMAVDLYERRDRIGGLWYCYGDKSAVSPPIPSTDPNGAETYEGQKDKFLSSMYDKLETNLVDTLMEYNGVPFQPRTENFITRQKVLEYLESYAHTIGESVNYSLKRDVLECTRQDGQWSVKIQNVDTLEIESAKYDAVVVANGHSELPAIPDVPGLKQWSERDPRSITHSRYFHDCTSYRDKVVLVIGNFASGMDLANQIGTTAKHVYVSTNEPEVTESDLEYIEKVRMIERYCVDTRSAHTIDGQVLANIDSVVFCTGYLYTLPFLRKQFPEITDGKFIQPLYKQIFHVEEPSLVFVGLPKFVSPLPLSESQGAVLARVFSGRMQLPSVEDRRSAFKEEMATRGSGKDFHSLKDCDSDYCNELYDWIKEAELLGEGLVPRYWDDKLKEKRRNVMDLKKSRNADISAYTRKLRKEGKPFDFPSQSQPGQ